jgi:hypothetical protein
MPTASPTPYPPTCGTGLASDLALSWADYEFLEGFLAHRFGLEEEILEPTSPWLDEEPCWAVPHDPAFTGPAWAPESLCGSITLDVRFTPIGYEVFQFQPQRGRGVAPLTMEAYPAHEDTSPNGLFRVNSTTGVVTVNSDLARYCGCTEEGWTDVHVELVDSNRTNARQTGALWIELTGCDEPVCPSATPSPSRSSGGSLSASGTPAPTQSRSRTATPSRPAVLSSTRTRTRRALRA